jgi:O-antigen/teichoic acid export membrane protein
MPLIPFAGVNMIMRFSDTWLLQHFGGSVEQAYYAVSSQFANISLIATASVLRILWKEVADANEKKNPEIVRELYHRASKILYFFSVIISGFLIPWVPTIIKLTLGDEYIAGTSVMMLMFLYPIHQSLGQVVGTMFYALELTRIYVIIGISFMLISTISVYFFLASSDSYIPGLGLGSLGLALKMVILQFLGVNFSIWYLARIKGWTYNPLYQIFIMMIFFSIGFLSYFLVSKISFLSSSLILGFLLSGFLYLVFSIIILYIKPDLIDVSRVEIKERIYVIFNFLRNRKA